MSGPIKVKSDAWKQCKMTKGTLCQTAWIPSKFAVVGKYLRIKDDDGWKVEEVSTVEMPEVTIMARSRDHLHTRDASDIDRQSAEYKDSLK